MTSLSEVFVTRPAADDRFARKRLARVDALSCATRALPTVEVGA